MRLERLEVGGFGRLSAFDVDFHPRLTVILGENESGKSTVHRALRAALYGIDAGGQGRPAERSDWSRWSPWNGTAYSVALSYALDDGRRVRVARRLENREQACQVHEIGGGDITDRLRIGRAVVPGQVHLGIDEAVFCASACLGDDGLRIGAADAPAARAAQVQEAIERLADSASATTATEALAALQEATRRVGSERRLTSPLGHAVNRLRQLDVQLDDARRRLATLAAEEERLRTLETDAVAAEERRADAERRWLLGRLAAIAAQRGEMEVMSAEVGHLVAEIEANAHLCAFPVEAEDSVVLLGAQLQEARRSADEAAARARAAAGPLAVVRRRRAEISSGTRALGETPVVDTEAAAELGEIRDERAALGGRRLHDELTASGARRDALRREIATTGMAATGPAAVETAIALVTTAQAGTRRWARRLGSVLVVCGAAGAAVALAGGHRVVGLIAAVVAAVIAVGLDRFLGADAQQARRRLRRVCPGAPTDDEGLRRLAERLPRLRALYRELEREEMRLETLAADIAAADHLLHALATRAEGIALQYGVGPISPDAGDSADARVRAVLTACDRATAVRQRREELDTEDFALNQRELELTAVQADAEQRGDASRRIEAQLARILDAAGIDRGLGVTESVARFREGCSGRARHAEALRRLDDLRRRRATTGDRHSLDRLREELETRLVSRGGDPVAVGNARPLAPAELQELETEADRARQAAVVAATAAAQLRARLGEMRANVPPLADLEDERAACIAARDRARRQLASLQRAAELIESATRGVHRDLAPQLATSVAGRLALLTEGRYSAVNVDTAHFAVALLGPDRPDLVGLELVSHGTRDQVSLLLRLALAEVLSGGGESVPVLLDEPLLSADPQRRATALRFLWKLSATNQVVLSTSDPLLTTSLHDCCDGERPTVVTMPPATAVLETLGRAVMPVRPL